MVALEALALIQEMIRKDRSSSSTIFLKFDGEIRKESLAKHLVLNPNDEIPICRARNIGMKSRGLLTFLTPFSLKPVSDLFIQQAMINKSYPSYRAFPTTYLYSHLKLLINQKKRFNLG